MNIVTRLIQHIKVKIKHILLSCRVIRNIKVLYDKVKNRPYEIVGAKENLKLPIVKNVEETLQHILDTNCSVCRFGDGEFSIMRGSANILFQNGNPKLAKRLMEVLTSTPDKYKIIICIPNVFGCLGNLNTNSRNFWRTAIIKERPFLYGLLNFDFVYWDALITRQYIDNCDNKEYDFKNYFNKFKLLWNKKNILIVEGELTRFGVGNDLLNNASSIKRILCPSINAFSKYEEILSTIINNHHQDVLILVALGPTATVLCYDLANIGYRSIDIGHLDIEYEWYKMGTHKKVRIKNKYVNEAGGIDTDNNNDYLYKSQIVATIN